MKHGVVPSFMAKPWGNVSSNLGCQYDLIRFFLASWVQWVSAHCHLSSRYCADSMFRHIHVSLRDKTGKNIFAVSESELSTGRAGAANDDTKFLSQEGEHFLAGVLDAIADGKPSHRSEFIHHC